VGVFGKEKHRTFRVATIGAVCVSLNALPDSEAIRGFVGRDGNVSAHERVSLFDSFRQFDSFRHGKSGHSRIAFGSRNGSIPIVPNSRPTPGSTQGPPKPNNRQVRATDLQQAMGLRPRKRLVSCFTG
jgi:hypothetical protein